MGAPGKKGKDGKCDKGGKGKGKEGNEKEKCFMYVWCDKTNQWILKELSPEELAKLEIECPPEKSCLGKAKESQCKASPPAEYKCPRSTNGLYRKKDIRNDYFYY